MADISSITLPGGGTYDFKDKNAVPKYGMGKNLLRNWYFGNPVNQREQLVYSTAGYTVDLWRFFYWNSTNPSTTLSSDGVTIEQTATGSNSLYLAQAVENWKQYAGKTITVSVLVTALAGSARVFLFGATDSVRYLSEILKTGLNTFTVQLSNDITGLQVAFGHHASAGGAGAVSMTVSAIKLELGSEQTLATLEGSILVLNEIPDYEYELYRCITSTADPSDTYANKSLATEQQLAYVETGTTASRAYAVGEYFCWNGLLYRAKTAISRGASFTVGTNCEQVTSGGFNELLTKATVVSGTTGASSETITISSGRFMIIHATRGDTSYTFAMAFRYNNWQLVGTNTAGVTINASTGQLTFLNYTIYKIIY